jgi:hypothetical protein
MPAPCIIILMRLIHACLVVILAAARISCAETDGSGRDADAGDAADAGDETGFDPVSEDPSSDACGDGLTLCNETCVNLDTDHSHCGLCNHACEAVEVCFDGVCTLECPADRENCSGSCVDLSLDPAHCGACGHACESGEECVGHPVRPSGLLGEKGGCGR